VIAFSQKRDIDLSMFMSYGSAKIFATFTMPNNWNSENGTISERDFEYRVDVKNKATAGVISISKDMFPSDDIFGPLGPGR